MGIQLNWLFWMWLWNLNRFFFRLGQIDWVMTHRPHAMTVSDFEPNNGFENPLVVGEIKLMSFCLRLCWHDHLDSLTDTHAQWNFLFILFFIIWIYFFLLGEVQITYFLLPCLLDFFLFLKYQLVFFDRIENLSVSENFLLDDWFPPSSIYFCY